MGIAAYNRGSKAIRASIAAEQTTPRELSLLREWSDYSRRHAGMVPFQDTVARFDVGRVYLMNRPDKGWSERSYTYDTIWALAKAWRVVFLDFGRDEHSFFVRVAPLPKEAA